MVLSNDTKTPYERVCELLLQLNPDELKDLAGRVAFLRKGHPDQEPEAVSPDADADWVLSVLTKVMRDLGVDFSGRDSLVKSKQYPAFTRKVPALMRYLRQGRTTRVQQYALLALGIRMLYQSMMEWGAPVSIRLVMQHIHRVPSYLEQAFPGYAKRGLLKKVMAPCLDKTQ